MGKKQAKYDAIVAGAGPAGTTCALFLSRSGKRVLLLDKAKFPRDKVCADNKTWLCIDIIRELGLYRRFAKLPKKIIAGVRVASPSGHILDTPLLASDIKQKGTWFNVRRLVFDNFLFQACKRSKKINARDGCEVVASIFDGKQIVGVVFRNEKGIIEKAYASVVVGADGSASVIADSVGIASQVKGRYALNSRAYYKGVAQVQQLCELYYLKGICPGYFWIFPVDNGLCNVGIGMRTEDIEEQNINLEEKLLEMTQSPAFKKRFSKAKRTTPVKTWGVSVLGKLRKSSGDGWLLVGDAGVFAMTFSGEGVGPSMRTGKLAAQAIVSALKKNDISAKGLSEYDRLLAQILKPEIKGFKWLEFLILHEKIFDWLLSRAKNNKRLISISSEMMRDYSAAQKIVSPTTGMSVLATKPTPPEIPL